MSVGMGLKEPALVEASGLGLSYGSRPVFHGLDISLQRGDVLAVTGPNGSGKSSLLRVLAGLCERSAGSLCVPPRKARGLAALDQRLYHSLTVREHADFVARVHGLGCPDLEPFGLLPQSGLLVGHLSSGQQSRLKMLLATFHEPALLLLDEPSVALDGPGRAVLAQVVAAQRGRGATVLATNDPGDLAYATHRLELAG
ncbi:MAG: ATP-binding cassette domain-containing protein [Fimbriimonadaceae bacterium]